MRTNHQTVAAGHSVELDPARWQELFTPRPTPLAVLVRVAGRRWTVEEAFPAGKGLAGLDQYQVRRWRSWYRWATLVMVAHAFPVIAALTERTRHPAPSGLIGLTCNESSTCCDAARPSRR